VIETFNKTLTVIRKNKLLFLILVIIQLLAVVTFTVIAAKSQLLLLEDLNQTLEPLQKANYDPQRVDTGQPFLEDMLPVLQSYAILKTHFINFIAWITFFFLVVNGVLWLGSHTLLVKYNVKQILNQWLYYLLAAIIGSAVLWAVGLILFKKLFSEIASVGSLESTLTKLGIATVIVYYLMLAAFAHINKTNLKNFGLAFFKSMKSLPRTLSYFSITTIVLGLCIYGIYMTSLIQQHFNLMIILVGLAIILVVIARLFLIIGLNDNSEELK